MTARHPWWRLLVLCLILLLSVVISLLLISAAPQSDEPITIFTGLDGQFPPLFCRLRFRSGHQT